MTQQETDLMTALAGGPVAEAQLQANNQIDAATGFVGRNVTVFYPMADGTAGRQCELTQLGTLYMEQQQSAQMEAEPARDVQQPT